MSSTRYELATGDPPQSTILTIELTTEQKDAMVLDVQEHGPPAGVALDLSDGAWLVRFFWPTTP